MKFPFYSLLAAAWLLSLSLTAQSQLNLELLGQYDRGDANYSGCWAYVAPDGREYALLGARSGTAIYALDGQDAPSERAFIPGPKTRWREITVIGAHAFVVTDVQDTGHQMQVISLAELPDTARLLATYDSTFNKGHIIQKDLYSDAPFVYVNGTTATEGVHILDVSDPSQPVEAGIYAPGYYIHDCHVRGNLLFAAAFYEATLDIVDISDKASPTLIGRIFDPGGNTHSASTTEDLKTLFLSDELDGLPGRLFDIQDLDNPVELATYTANPSSLTHNPYIRGDFAFVSHNTEGLRVVDIADPAVPVEVGYYDTYEGPSGGFHGLWSACPYLPSGRIIGGNREDGLYLWQFNGTRAGRFYAQVVDSLSGEPLFNAVAFIEETGAVYNSGFDGRLGGGALPGNYLLRVFSAGYNIKSISISLEEGSQENFTIELSPVVSNTNDGQPEQPRLRIAPNPFQEQAILSTSLFHQASELLLLKNNGKQVRRYRLQADADLIIEGAGLTSGPYWVLVLDRSGHVIAREQVLVAH